MILQITIEFTFFLQDDKQNLTERALAQILVFKIINYFLYILWVCLIFRICILNILPPTHSHFFKLLGRASKGFLPHLIITQLAKRYQPLLIFIYLLFSSTRGCTLKATANSWNNALPCGRGKGEGREAGREGSHLSKHHPLIISHVSFREKGTTQHNDRRFIYWWSREILLILESILLKSHLRSGLIYSRKIKERTAALKIDKEPIPVLVSSTKPWKQESFLTYL